MKLIISWNKNLAVQSLIFFPLHFVREKQMFKPDFFIKSVYLKFKCREECLASKKKVLQNEAFIKGIILIQQNVFYLIFPRCWLEPRWFAFQNT
jgi:hypothetical protein